MNWFKIIFISALSIILIVSTLVALFGAGRILNAAFSAYVFKVESCRYEAKHLPVGGEEGARQESERTCEVDYNRAKRDMAGGLGMLLVAAPLAAVAFWQTRRMMREG